MPGLSWEEAFSSFTRFVNSLALETRRASTSWFAIAEAPEPSATATVASCPSANSSTCEPEQPLNSVTSPQAMPASITTAKTAATMAGALLRFGRM